MIRFRVSLRIFCALAACFVFAAQSAKAGAAPLAPASVTITIDDTVVTRLLTLIGKRDDSAKSIDAWIDLPGNAELLKVGALEGQLTRAQLRANVKAVIDGAATNASQPPSSFGRVLLLSPADTRAMLAELHARAQEWLTRTANRDAAYAPAGLRVSQTVYLHLGGDWDALNRDGAIYVDMAYFHDYFTPSWFGLDLLLAHETFHAVQNAAFGNPESTGTSDEAFFTALSKIQREGTARLVEVEADPGGYTPGTYGFYFRAVDTESLREFAASVDLLDELAAACYPKLNSANYTDAVSQGLSNGGVYYTIGEGIAAGIERYAGHARLVQTVARGPLDFFDCYIALTRRHAGLAKLPAGFAAEVERLKRQHPDGRVPAAS